MKYCYMVFGWGTDLLALSLSLSKAQSVEGARYIERRPFGVRLDSSSVSMWVRNGADWLEVPAEP